jgi:hypothetical protein
MTAKKTTAAAKQAPAKRTPLVREGVDPRDGATADVEQDDAKDLAQRTAESVVAAAPTPNQSNDLEAANKAPGAGGVATPPAPPPAARPPAKQVSDEEVEVEPTPRHFQLMDDNGQLHPYPAGTTKMLKEHAEHWYSEANGVVIK